MLKIEGVSKTFNPGTPNETAALNGLDLSLREGEFLTVVGGNGSGKSTLLNIVAGVTMTDAGRIVVAGADLTALPEHRRAAHVGRVFQDPLRGTAADMTIEENLALAARRGARRGLSRGLTRADRRAYREALARLDLGLEDRMSAPVGTLSGGQRQALTLLMATLRRPKVLLLDEHTAALDPKTADKVLRLSESLVRGENLTCLMVTHNMRDAIRYGDRLVMMEAGQIIFEAEGAAKEALTPVEMVRRFAGSRTVEEQAV